MHAHDLDAMFELARSRGVADLWLITSGEVEASPKYYRTIRTQETLLAWHPFAWYLGADEMTRVYRIVGERPLPPPSALEGAR
jgi:hypothetical protein